MLSPAFSPLDVIMDLSMLMTVQLVFGALRPSRLLASFAVLNILTSLVFLLNPASAIKAVIHLPVFILTAGIVTGERRTGRIIEAAACMFCTSAAAAGFISLGNRAAVPAAVFGIPLLLFLLRRHRHENYRWNIEVYVEKDGLGASLPALIDTGNRLKEHHSGLPVFIAEADALAQIAVYVQTLPQNQLRILPFGVLGATGEIACFRPDRIEILIPGRGAVPAPPCWVAVYHGRIPGSTCALAPPVFTKALETKRSIFKRHFIE